MLEEVVKRLNMKMFKGKSWIFRQDSALAHKARTTHVWLQHNLPRFITVEDWTSSSPDLNPLDYLLRAQLESIACVKPHKSIDRLKKAFTKAVNNFPIDTICRSIGDWPECLCKCIAVQGGHFE